MWARRLPRTPPRALARGHPATRAAATARRRRAAQGCRGDTRTSSARRARVARRKKKSPISRIKSDPGRRSHWPVVPRAARSPARAARTGPRLGSGGRRSRAENRRVRKKKKTVRHACAPGPGARPRAGGTRAAPPPQPPPGRPSRLSGDAACGVGGTAAWRRGACGRKERGRRRGGGKGEEEGSGRRAGVRRAIGRAIGVLWGAGAARGRRGRTGPERARCG